MKQTTLVTMMVLALVFSIAYVSAEVVSPLTLTEGASSTRSFASTPAKSVEAEGGNVTALNIDMLAQTQSWQGYFGNITGNIVLDNANNDTFYNWTITTVQGEVYATRNATADFSTTNCASAGERSSEETFLGKLATDGDSVTNTFNTTTHPAFNVSTTTVSNCYETNAFSNDALDTGRFQQVLLADDASSIIYATLIDADQVAFDGGQADFQILVGEPSTAGTTTYYFFVELD